MINNELINHNGNSISEGKSSSKKPSQSDTNVWRSLEKLHLENERKVGLVSIESVYFLQNENTAQGDDIFTFEKELMTLNDDKEGTPRFGD